MTIAEVMFEVSKTIDKVQKRKSSLCLEIGTLTGLCIAYSIPLPPPVDVILEGVAVEIRLVPPESKKKDLTTFLLKQVDELRQLDLEVATLSAKIKDLRAMIKEAELTGRMIHAPLIQDPSCQDIKPDLFLISPSFAQ